MEWKPRRAYTGEGKEDGARLVIEMDMNNQKVKESNPPSFRPAEVGGLGRRYVGLDRAFGSTVLKLWGGSTPLAQPKAQRVREKNQKRKRKSRARMIKMGEGDLRSAAPISVAPPAIPLLYHHRKNRTKTLLLSPP